MNGEQYIKAQKERICSIMNAGTGLAYDAAMLAVRDDEEATNELDNSIRSLAAALVAVGEMVIAQLENMQLLDKDIPNFKYFKNEYGWEGMGVMQFMHVAKAVYWLANQCDGNSSIGGRIQEFYGLVNSLRI